MAISSARIPKRSKQRSIVPMLEMLPIALGILETLRCPS
jgi:hypothetical protein